MRFRCLKHGETLPRSARDQFYLVPDRWDDWFQFETRFMLYSYDSNSVKRCIGMVKIAKAGMRGESFAKFEELKSSGADVANIRKTILPDEFDTLPIEYFSLGNEDSYYETLGRTREGRSVLKALNDIAYNQTRCRQYRDEDVMKVSLMRGITDKRIRDRFAKLARNKVVLTDYEFEYTYPHVRGHNSVRLNFKISTDPIPPSNIKVIIGRNGVGKTFLLRNIAYSLCRQGGISNEFERTIPPIAPKDCGRIKMIKGDIYGVVYASFSPLETSEWEPVNPHVKFVRIGIEPERADSLIDNSRNADSPALQNDVLHSRAERQRDLANKLEAKFADELSECLSEPWLSRFLKCIEILKADPMFAQLSPEDLFSLPISEMKHKARSFFHKLSSGHGALLLIVTQLVRRLDEKFLLLIDEPECHLHPPLLALFVNCLSWLLGERNAVAIIATHSPVILQSVVRDSVWIINRFERDVVVQNPENETFGENVGLLMRGVFGLELDKLGYHRMLSDMIRNGGHTFDEVVSKFGGHLGVEAKAVLRTMIEHQIGDLNEENS